MKILFICNQNENRSKTAEMLFKKKYEVKSAGLFNGKPVTKKQLNWADLIIVMEEHQRGELAKRFPKIYIQKQIISLNIPDIYRFNQPELKTILRNKFNSYSNILAIH